MGSLVMSQVAPGFGQHPYHHMMVDGDSHHDEDERASHTHPERNSNSTHSSEPRPIVAASDRPSSPGLHPRDTQTSSNVPPPAAREPSSDAQPIPPRTSSSYVEQSLNNHSRGFDQAGFPLSHDPYGLASSPSSPRLQPTYRSTRSLGGSEATSPSRIRVRDLSHIQSFASEEYLARPRLGPRTFSDSGRQYEISSMPVTDIIEMVAGLLTKITTTNDRQHEHLHRPIPPSQDQASLNSQASCVLAFHGKNVPSITILSYLSRIHKYCPTTYEVFLSLLVYFDRMTESFNRRFLDQAQGARTSDSGSFASQDSSNTSLDTLTGAEAPRSPMPMNVDHPQERPTSSGGTTDLSQFFVVDSYNIHRLVIAGVTCASKFFSDVFYTNSRYAKVGGLPLAELNNLELQFLLLNDFRLSVPVEELEAYGTMLVEFYAREIVAQQQATQSHHQSMQQAIHGGDEMYMRGSTRKVPQTATTS